MQIGQIHVPLDFRGGAGDGLARKGESVLAAGDEGADDGSACAKLLKSRGRWSFIGLG